MIVRAFILASAFLAGFLLPLAGTDRNSAAQADRHLSGQLGFQRLEGRWVRPDGGYTLELRNIKKDGSMTVSYYNPKPIKVFRAAAKREDGKIHLFIELRDVNYPGSTYTLQYDPASDRLQGTYFQAVERSYFDVVFVRSQQ